MNRAWVSSTTIFALVSMGCVSEYHGGAQTAAQSGGPITQSATLGGSLAWGDSRGAFGPVIEGSLGVDDRSGRASGSVLYGFEYSTYGGEPVSAERFALLAGWTGTTRAHDEAALIALRYGHAWVLGVSEDGRGITSLSLDPTLGAVIVDPGYGRRSGVMIGLGLTLRYEHFSEWIFRHL